MVKTLQRIAAGKGVSADLDLLISVAKNIEGNTVCALGDAAAWPVKFTIERFRDEFEKAVNQHVTLPVYNKVHGLRKTETPLKEIEH